MREFLRVTWTVTPLRPPEPWRFCSHCHLARKFQSTGKFRANSQKKRIDIWLIYRCETCNESWNFPVLERATARTIDELAGYMQNEPSLARRFAFDLARLRQHTGRIEPCGELMVKKAIVSGSGTACNAIEITVRLREPSELRLDSFIARELDLSRTAIARLSDARHLCLRPETRKGMRAILADGQIVTITLDTLDEERRMSLIRSALGTASQASP